jgi:hypothetical protein
MDVFLRKLRKKGSRIEQIVQDRVKMERMYACKDEKKQMGACEKDSSTAEVDTSILRNKLLIRERNVIICG